MLKTKIDISTLNEVRDLMSVKIIGFPLFIKEDGIVRILFRNKGEEEWQTLREVPIRINPSSNEI